MPAVELSIDDLLLDTQNPRIGSAAGQRDAIQKVLDDQGERLYVLADHIIREGMSPIERLLVFRPTNTSKRYIVLEGNRRVAALKILANPNVLAGFDLRPALRRRFEALAGEFDRTAVEPIACFEVARREDGTEWLYLRHTGANEGRGVVDWSGLATARFRGRDPALQALEFVRKFGDLTGEQNEHIGQRFPITTLDRLLSSREVRKRIGVSVNERKLCSGLPAKELMKPLRRIVLDLGEKKINVSRLKNTDQQIEYIETFGTDDRPDLSKHETVRPLEDIQEGEFKQKEPKKRRKPDPSERKTIVPRNHGLNVEDNRTAAVLQELRRLKVDECPNAIAVLLRVFLELSTDHYLDTQSISLKYKDTKSGRMIDKTLKKKVNEVIDHLVKHKKCDRKDFQGVLRALSVEHSPFYIDLLHAYLHNRFVTPKSRDLISAWDDARRFFESIWP